MNDITNNLMTAEIPSSFGMPTRTHDTSARPGVHGTTASTGEFIGQSTGQLIGMSVEWSIVRDRKAVVTGDLGLAPAYFGGTAAWRPPIC